MSKNEVNLDSASNGGVDALRRILGKFPFDAKGLALLTLHLYEVYDGSRRYLESYKKLFTLPIDPNAEWEELADILIEMKVLLEDIERHGLELRGLVDSFVNHFDSDDRH